MTDKNTGKKHVNNNLKNLLLYLIESNHHQCFSAKRQYAGIELKKYKPDSKNRK